MAAQAAQAKRQTAAGEDHERSMQGYLDKAVDVLEKFGIKDQEDAPAELIRLLEEVRHVDEARALAIANTIKHMSKFNQLVRPEKRYPDCFLQQVELLLYHFLPHRK